MPRPPSRVSMRALAAIAGVCPMTVSLALRNHPSISEATRVRVREIAENNGYVPDPVIGRLMRHLRSQDTQSSATVCSLCLRASSTQRGYAEDIFDGAKARAQKLGFFFDSIWLDETGLNAARLKRVLRSRGIEAVLLLPMAQPLDLTPLLDWSTLAAVATSATITGPHVHSVLPDQFGNILRLCAQMKAEGVRRIGLLTVREQDVRVQHRVAAAVTWHNLEAGCPEVVPLVVDDWEVNPVEFRNWYVRTQPDLLMSDSQGQLDRMRELVPAADRDRLRFVCTTLNFAAPIRYAGIAEDARGIGAAAIDQLNWMYQSGERGIPARPLLTLVPGTYQSAPAPALAPVLTMV